MFRWASSPARNAEDAEEPPTPTDPSGTPGAASRLTRSSGPSIPVRPSATEAEQFAEISRRAQQLGSASEGLLQAPLQRDIARDRLRRASRSRTPSPRPRDTDVFDYNFTMDEETVQRLMEAAIRATQSSSTQQVQSLKKPDLPPFDKRNVEIWVKRVEAAYARVHCTSPALKFAHLESKFEVNQDPIVDGFLFGDATDDSWNAFIAYLIKRYGPTTKDRALSVINGTPREGRTPSQLVAVMKEKAGKVTLDDIMKEQLLKQLPQDVLKQIVDRVDGLTCDETAKLADAWFNKDGKPLLSTDATSIHNVDRLESRSNPSPTPSTTPDAASASASSRTTPFTAAFDADDDEADINAVRFRQGQKQSFNVQNREGARGRGRGRGAQNSGGRGAQSGSGRGSNNNTNSYGNSSSYGNSNGGGEKRKQVCKYHINFGDKARQCEQWCMLNPQHKAPKGKPVM